MLLALLAQGLLLQQLQLDALEAARAEVSLVRCRCRQQAEWRLQDEASWSMEKETIAPVMDAAEQCARKGPQAEQRLHEHFVLFALLAQG